MRTQLKQCLTTHFKYRNKRVPHLLTVEEINLLHNYVQQCLCHHIITRTIDQFRFQQIRNMFDLISSPPPSCPPASIKNSIFVCSTVRPRQIVNVIADRDDSHRIHCSPYIYGSTHMCIDRYTTRSYCEGENKC